MAHELELLQMMCQLGSTFHKESWKGKDLGNGMEVI